MSKFSSKKAYREMTTYEQVYTILEENPETRSSDKKLFWEYWRRQGIIKYINGNECISRYMFIKIAAVSESIRRSRQKIQEEHRKLVAEGSLKIADSLLADSIIAEARSEKEKEKGTHIFREQNPTLID